MDIGIISLIVSGVVAVLHFAGYLESRTNRKEAQENKFAKAEGVTSELVTIRADIKVVAEKLEDHGRKISSLQLQNAICETIHDNTADEMDRQVRALEQLVLRVEGIR